MIRATTALLACAAALAAALTAAMTRAAPVSRPIVVDSDMSDWETVLTNPANAARDGDGHSMACIYSSDRDCSVGGREMDLSRFAWTWDATQFHVFMERYGNSGGWEYFYVFLDTDLDALMEANEPVIRLRLNGDGTSNDLQVARYNPALPAGDALQDAQQRADGHVMPGALVGIGPAVQSDRGADALGRRFEGSVPWAALGVAPGAPMNFHVGSSQNTNVPASMEDNMGGTGGGMGTTAWRAVDVSGSSVASAAPTGTATLLHRVCNDGNVAARIDVRVQSLLGVDVVIHRDDDGDGFGDVFLGMDDGGDGSFARPADDLDPAGDTNSDGVLDLGVLAAGQCVDLVLQQTYPNSTAGQVEELTIEAWRADDPTILDEATDLVTVARYAMRPPVERLGVPGSGVWLPHVVQNNSAGAARIDLRATSTLGWAWTFYWDPNADGDPSDAIALFDADATGLPDIGTTAGEEVAIFARVAVPAGANVGQEDVAQVCAIVTGSCRSQVTDRVVVAQAVDVVPDHVAALGDERYGAAGGSIYYAHEVLSAQDFADRFLIVAASDVGWACTVLTDPDGDGRPYDSAPLTGLSAGVPPNGGTFPFLVKVDLPAGSATGSSSRITVTAISNADPAVRGSGEDDAFTAIVRAYEDPGYAVNLARTRPCETVHAQASGLPASVTTARFVWRRPDGTSVRVFPTSSDAQGQAQDALALPVGEVGLNWRADIQLFDGFTFVTQDSAVFDVVDDVVLESLVTGASVLHVADANVTASASLFNTSTSVTAVDVGLRWVVLTPDGTRYLRSNGTFAPYSGTEATATNTINRIDPEDSRNRGMGVASVDFPEQGTYSIQLHQGSSCGGAFLAGTVTFEVKDDEDGDGLERTVELGLGTDPADADTDDDGRTDPSEGAGDADLDGIIDALECDADGDLLPDGLEVGLTDPDDDTDVPAGCFRADSWPGTTTDPARADTDGGGVPDGREDRDSDGRVDAGEIDPLVAADDVLADTDADLVRDLDETAAGTDPEDADSDDDGVRDGDEWGLDSDVDAVPDALECDADGDGIFDGIERGLTAADPDTDPAGGCFSPDADPSTRTDPTSKDSDLAGVSDGDEDADGDGAVNGGETDPENPADDDGDGDGLPNLAEDAAGTSRADRDSDDDGLIDGRDATGDADGDGRADVLECDSDGDGLGDGLESGVDTPDVDTDLSTGCFVIDADPSTTTDPLRRDSDSGGVDDGAEDSDRDGAVGAGERDPNDSRDDACSVTTPAEVTGLRLAREGASVKLTWDHSADACSSYTAWKSAEPRNFAAASVSLGMPEHVDPAVGPLVFFVVSTRSRLAGDGP